MAEGVIDRAIAGVADRMPVDWAALEQEAGSDEDKGWLNCLRVLGGIADLHQAIDAEEGSEAEETRPVGASVQTAGGDRLATEWGKYRLVQKVGEGGFGSVYRAWDPDLELEVAIKILHRRIADARLKEALLREGRALARVRHNNVVRVLSVENQDDQIALRMEFVHGETLEDVLRRHGTLNAREAALIGEDVCRALAAVHLAGFVHRDVKARNVMREKAGRIVLMDFGAGQHADDLKVPGQTGMVGTPVYMAPDVLGGQPASVSSDIYSVGVLLYRLVTGEYPVEGKSFDDIRLAHMQGKRRLLSERRPDLPPAFIGVVERALAADPSKRYSTAAALLEALGGVAGRLAADATLFTRRNAGRLLLGISGAAVAITAFGAVSSAKFNTSLGLAEFASENAWDWFVWGLKASLAPVTTLVLYTLIVALLAVVHRLVIVAVPGATQTERRATAAARRIARATRLTDPTVAASLVVLLSTATLFAAWWYFDPLFTALSEHVSTVKPPSLLAILSPDFYDYQLLYRKTFFGVSVVTLIAWYAAVRLSRPGEAWFHWTISVGAAAVAVLAVGSLQLPYRLLLHNTFETARWRGVDCYVLGERDRQILISCPALDPPRNRIIEQGDAEFRRTGNRESIFARFQQMQKAPESPVGR